MNLKLVALLATIILPTVLSQENALFVKRDAMQSGKRVTRQTSADKMVQNILNWIQEVYSQNSRKIRQGSFIEYLPPTNTQKPRPFKPVSPGDESNFIGYPPAGKSPIPAFPDPKPFPSNPPPLPPGFTTHVPYPYPTNTPESYNPTEIITHQPPTHPPTQPPTTYHPQTYPPATHPPTHPPITVPETYPPPTHYPPTHPPTTHYPPTHPPTTHYPPTPPPTTHYPTTHPPTTYYPPTHPPTTHYPPTPPPTTHYPTTHPPTTYYPPTHPPTTHYPPTPPPTTHYPPTYPPTTHYPPTHPPTTHYPPTYPPTTHYPPTPPPTTHYPPTTYPPTTYFPPTYPPTTIIHHPEINPPNSPTTHYPEIPIHTNPIPTHEPEIHPVHTHPTEVYTHQPSTLIPHHPAEIIQTESPVETTDAQEIEEVTLNPQGDNELEPSDESSSKIVESEDLKHPPHIHAIDVECAKDMMKINIEFNRKFDGIIYSKGYYSNADCRYVAENSGDTKYSFTVSLNSCGTEFINGFDTEGQSYLENVLVLQNEAGIQEVWDTIRAVRCLWEGNLNKALSVALSVGMLSQEIVTFSGDTAMAKLDIQLGRGPFAPTANGLVKIGEVMTLVVSVTGDPGFDLQVKDCRAKDSDNNENIVALTDDNGCVLKPKLFGAFQKTRNTGNSGASIIAYAFFNAFKFPDVMDLMIECNVELCKTDCDVCPDPGQKIDPGRRRKRDIESNNTLGEPITMAKTLRIILPEDLSDGEEIINLNHRDVVCMSMFGFVIAAIILIFLLLVSTLFSAYIWMKHQRLVFRKQ